MPFDKFLNNNINVAPVKQTGATPDYDPFGKFEEDYNKLNKKVINDVIDFTLSKTGNEGRILDIDADKYSDYDIYINDVQTQEELDKERANNQTALEQTGRALVNTAAEVLLGIPIGFADIGDALLNVNNPQNDYQNAVSSTLTEWKEAINERMKVYQENPDEAFNGSDWGWWMSHAPSIVTSISLMVPALGVSGALGKAGSFVGKAGRALSKVNALKPFNSVANKFNVFSKMSQQTRDTLGAMTKAGIEGATMRVGENYLEARETFNQIEDYATKEFASMSKEERDEFFNNNPQYKGWNDEDIIKDIASNSADITFKSDLINGVFDIIQIYGMRNMWNNKITRDLTGSASLNRLNKLTAKMFGQDAKAIQEAAKGGNMLAKTKIGIADFLDNSFRLARTEWTEGIEEAINYVSSQEGIYAGKKVFNKNINPNTLEDYLRDPFMWESALWGLIGGVVFGQAYPAAMKGIGKLNAKRLGQDFITAEKQKEAEIYSRIAITENYVNELTKIESGKNPFDNDAQIDDNEKESLKELAGKRYIDALVTNAANAGNLDLLESFMHDNNFNKGFREKLGINEEESNKILTQFDRSFAETKQTYMDVLSKASRAGASFEIAKIISSDAVDAKHGIETWNTLKSNAQRKFDSLVSQSHLAEEVGSYIEDAKDGIVINEIDSIRKKLGILEKNTAVKEKDRKTSILKLQKDIERLNKIRNVESIDDLNKKIKLEAARRLYKEQREIYNSYIQLAQRENVVLYAKENNKTDDITIKNKIQELNNFFDSARKKVVDGAFEDMTKMYRKYGKNIINEYLDKKTGEIEEADKKLIDNAIIALKLDEEGNKFLSEKLKNLGNITEIERTRRAENPEDVKDEKEDEEANTGDVVNDLPSTEGQTQQTGNGQQTGNNPPPVGESSIQKPLANNNAESNESNEQIVSAIETNNTQEQSNKINIPKDEVEQFLLAQEVVEELLDEYDVDMLSNIENHETIVNEVRDKLIKLGFQEDIALDTTNASVSSYNGKLAASTDDSIVVIVPNILKFTRNKDVNNLRNAIEAFVNTEFNGKPYGRIYNGKMYFSMSDLMSYLKNVPSSFLYETIFDSVKEYIFSTENVTIKDKNNNIIQYQYVITDDETINAIDKYQIHDYIQLYDRARRKLIKNLSNEVNIDNLFDGTNEQIAARVVEFAKLQTDTDLPLEIDSKNKRVYVRKNGRDLGYMGIANQFETDYSKDMENWRYDFRIDDKEIIHSDFMNWLMTFITDQNKVEQIDKWFELFKSNPINFKKEVFYDENVKNDTYKAFHNYANFVNWLLANGGDKFITPDVNSITDKAIAANHIYKILRTPVSMSDTENLYNWFKHIASSYLMTEEIVNTSRKKVKISRIVPGVLNTEQTRDYEGTLLNEAIVGYDENKHQLGLVLKEENNDDRLLYLAKSDSPILSKYEGVSDSLNIVVKIPRPDRTSAYAACKQTLIGDIESNKAVQQILNGILSEVRYAVDRFYQNQGDVAFDDFVNHLKYIFGNDALIRGITVAKKSNGGAKIDYNGNTIFFLNPPGGINKKTGTANEKNIKDVSTGNLYHKSSKEQAISVITKTLLNAMRQGCTFAVGKSYINDGLYPNRKNNPFIYRENGKTIIRLGSVVQEYKSYQDFLVSNGLIKTKLKNDKTPRIVTDPKTGKELDGVIAYGNFVYSKGNTGLKVRLPIVVPKPAGPIPVAVERNDILNEAVTSEDIDSISETINDPENFITYIENVAKTSGVMTETMVKFYKEIYDTGILKMPIEIKYRTGHKAFALYNPANETVYIDRSRWEYDIRNGKRATIARLMNIIIHENVHGYIDMQNKSGNNLSKKITKAFEPIYKEYRVWFDSQSEEFKNNPNNKLLARIKDDGKELTDIDYEEFMIESMTNGNFMKQLNSIKTTSTSEIKKPTLFAKIMDIIAKLFGININNDSLLAKARAAANSINEDNQNNNEHNETISDTTIENNNDLKEPTVHKPINDDNPFGNDNDNPFDSSDNNGEGSLPFANTYDALTIYDARNRLPMSVQARFDSLIDTGEIGFTCK